MPHCKQNVLCVCFFLMMAGHSGLGFLIGRYLTFVEFREAVKGKSAERTKKSEKNPFRRSHLKFSFCSVP